MGATKIELEWHWRALYDAFNDEAKYVTIRVGRRGGKTFGAFQWLIAELFEQPRTALWVDTVHNNIEAYVDRYLLYGEGTKLKPILGQNICSWNKQKKILKFPNNSFIQFGSAERPELLEGFEYDRTVINEAGIVMRKPNLWHNTIEPMCRGSYNKTRMIGTPKGKNMFATLCRKNDVRYNSFHFSALDSPYWDTDELSLIKQSIPERVWRQEYLAEILDDGGLVFRKVRDAVSDNITIEEDGRYVFGIDWAKYNDFSVVTVLDIHKRKVVEIDRFNQIDWHLQRQRFKALYERYKPAVVIAEQNSYGDGNIEILRREGYDIRAFTTTNATKAAIIDNLATAFEMGQITIPNNEVLINELESMEATLIKSGLSRYAAPEGLHDDCVISLALAWEGSRKAELAWV